MAICISLYHFFAYFVSHRLRIPGSRCIAFYSRLHSHSGLIASCALLRTFLHRLCCILCSSFCFRTPRLHSVAWLLYAFVGYAVLKTVIEYICVVEFDCKKYHYAAGLCYLLPHQPSDAVLDNTGEDLTAKTADTPACRELVGPLLLRVAVAEEQVS